MNAELNAEWEADRKRINKIAARIYDEEEECFDIWEYACELEELATKYLFRFATADKLRVSAMKKLEEQK